MKNYGILLLPIAVVLAIGCGARHSDPAHIMSVRCDAVQCSSDAWVSYLKVLNADTSSSPHEGDYFICSWDNGDSDEALSLDGGCFACTLGQSGCSQSVH